MKAEEFVNKINNLRKSLDYFNHFSENITSDIKNENKYFSDKEFNDEFVRRSCVIGTYFSTNDKKVKSRHEIDNLISNFKNENIFRLLNGVSFFNEILIFDQLFIFGNLDSYICYNNVGEVSWHDLDTLELKCKISNSPESFLDCMYELANNNINRSLTNIDLLNKLLNLSGEKESEVFYKYLLGIDD
jgi:hypothetical protein